jgi:hypothetical protein
MPHSIRGVRPLTFWDPYGDLKLANPALVEDMISTLAQSVAETA